MKLAVLTYNFNNHIKFIYQIKKLKSREVSEHYEVQLITEMPDFYKNYLSDPKNSNVSQIQGIMDRRDKQLNEIVKKDIFMVSLGKFFHL